MMRYLFGDLLPDAVLSRTTKASFNQTRWGSFEREYARNWSGEGIDPDLIDAEKLRAAWLSDDPPPGRRLPAARCLAGQLEDASANERLC